MILRTILPPVRNEAPPSPIVPVTRPEYVSSWGTSTTSGQRVSPESAKTISTAYRCGNILSDDIASLPFQVFIKGNRSIKQVDPDPKLRNTAYLLEMQPNRWMTPFIFKKTIVLWMIYYGNAYVWQPTGKYREWFILDADKTQPGFDDSGNSAFKTRFPDGSEQIIPGVEVLHLMINSTDGLSGKSVLAYARETMGRQLGAHDTQNRIHSQGLNPTAALYVDGELNEEARKKLKESYINAIRGSSNSGGVAIFDSKVTKFETITMTPSDAQFLETIQATDAEIANFYGLPLHKLNMGKQSYESNEAQQLDYLNTTLNPYLVQWEQGARLKWLTEKEQVTTYLRFIREALMRTDAKTRSTYLKDQILSGQMTPNEARQINDMSAFEGGDAYYIPANMARVSADGTLIMGVGISTAPVKEEQP
ncbi:MAG: phage portal protein [Chloroflexi bacterium HGW-Chloroflexi-8]|nr:MAG: phage portal protein [Chloroflexi bacterium HGW-Chloroflexi-8]